jgi:hypothetical protein
VTLVLVSREALGLLLTETYTLMHSFAVEGGCYSEWEAEWKYLEPGSPLVTLAVEAGLPLPGPMEPGSAPPPPPRHPFDPGEVFRIMATIGESEELVARAEEQLSSPAACDVRELVARVYRTEDDPRLRCAEDGKVAYTTKENAEAAAHRISEREPMRAYLGDCGHYHVSRRNK